MTDPMDRERQVKGGAEVGDPVCWLHRLCQECGAMPTADMSDRCWRCDTPPEDDGCHV